MFDLYGYAPLVLSGARTTASLMLFSIILSTFFGILGALCKTSRAWFLRWPVTVYTTVIRAVPDLVLMLIIFYGIQAIVNDLATRYMGTTLTINSFWAGVVTLAFIYGSYMTETFRGAFESVPHGQHEAAFDAGMGKWLTFRLITLPQMVRFAVPSYSNNMQVVIKSTALVSILGLTDIISITQRAGASSQRSFFFNLVAAFVYLVLTSLALIVLRYVDKRYNVGVQKAPA